VPGDGVVVRFPLRDDALWKDWSETTRINGKVLSDFRPDGPAIPDPTSDLLILTKLLRIGRSVQRLLDQRARGGFGVVRMDHHVVMVLDHRSVVRVVNSANFRPVKHLVVPPVVTSFMMIMSN